jgi:hypothetical protein
VRRDGPDGAFDSVVIKLDAAVLQESAKRRPAAECIPDRICNAATGRKAIELGFKPDLHRCDQR